MQELAEHDVLDADWDQNAWWTTTNFGEAVPGVLTALNWSFWSEHGERAIRRVFHTLGVLPASGLEVPEDPAERVLGVFCGRIAGKVDFLGWVGDRLPGTTGAKVAESLIGELPQGFTSTPTRERWLAVARRLPPTFVSLPRRLRAIDAQTATWWRGEVARPPADLATAKARFAGARAWFERALFLQILSIFAGVQPVYDRVQALAARAGDPELAPRLLAGQGSHAELAMVEGLWSLSRGRTDVASFIAEHGFHLTATELLAATPERSLRDLVGLRARQRDEHAARSLPAAWRGRPEVVVAAAAPAAVEGTVLSGLGVSPGVVEAPVRVLLTPDHLDVADGEILVARFTDPSWASIMPCSRALVVEVGGALSHAAVMARELGVPCVMGVQRATARLRTGDVCRVDGHAGTVEIVQPALR